MWMHKRRFKRLTIALIRGKEDKKIP